MHPSFTYSIRILLLLVLLSVKLGACKLVLSNDRPNILWITAEDMSPHLGCYGDPNAITPHLDALARESIRYDNAFATAPVCSPSRSCLITGVFATSLGTQRLRSQFPIPKSHLPFTSGLRANGWYCTNNVKTDYNIQNEEAFVKAAWDENSSTANWRSRPTGKEFFAIFNLMTTHQSRTSAWTHDEFEKEVGGKLSSTERHHAERLTLPPYYPDTLESRRAWARYHDCITLMDRQVGELLEQLKGDGLDDDTIVFFYSDHGMGMPRGKRCLQDSGLRIPLLVRFPEKWKHLAPSEPGTISDRLVSFVDFAPTVLSLCGLSAPLHYQGTAFLGAHAGPPPRFVHGARDRVDEAFDVSRSVRDQRWLYIRNFMPHLPWMQPEAYSDTSIFRQELKLLALQGKLDSAARMYTDAPRPLEELYDTEADPHQLKNLVDDEAYGTRLEVMRAELRRWQMQTRDAGFLTEPQMWARMQDSESAWDVAHDSTRYPLARLLDAADAVGRDNATKSKREWLGDLDDSVRYWAALGFRARAKLDLKDIELLSTALRDTSPSVKIEAAAALAMHGKSASAIPVLIEALHSESRETVLHSARTLELLGKVSDEVRTEMQEALDKAREDESAGNVMSMFIRFSLEAALDSK
ncbi:MAG: sulfatase-like hydrolase/transferase [Pirellulaceae bacterium]|nr:sulfatase-like hydrolase/transferase [Pirellulaceae bacterium]